MAILNYTTQIAVDKSVSEIQRVLAKQGANKIMIEYDGFGVASSLLFAIPHLNNELQFRLPANYTGVLRALNKCKIAAKFKTNEQAKKVSWRILKDWVEAQMAIIESEQASIMQVYLPYAITANGSTVSETLLSDKGNSLLLKSGS